MLESHATDWELDAPTPAQLKEFFAQIESRRMTKARLQKALGKSSYTINCDTEPFEPEGWSTKEHRLGGQLEWDPLASRLCFYQSGNISIPDLQKELEDKLVMNTNILDWWLENQNLIPKECRTKKTYFLGTIYGNQWGDSVIRYLYLSDGIWRWSPTHLSEFRFTSNCQVLLMGT